ncbi:MAG TPA: hypothetical protein VGK85_08700 [Myxococcaceae bacterium]|jgi:hypothetical protein
MTRKPETPEDVRKAADLAESDRAESADGLPLPPPGDDDTRLARDTGEPEDAAEDEEGEEQDVVEQISAERGAD